MTITIELTDDDVLDIKEALAQRRGPIGGDALIDIVDGQPVVTDHNVETWAEMQLQERIDALKRDLAEQAVRAAFTQGPTPMSRSVRTTLTEMLSAAKASMTAELGAIDDVNAIKLR